MSRSGYAGGFWPKLRTLRIRHPVEGAFFVPNIWGVTSCSMDVSGAPAPGTGGGYSSTGLRGFYHLLLADEFSQKGGKFRNIHLNVPFSIRL